jgi:transcriptional regulator
MLQAQETSLLRLSDIRERRDLLDAMRTEAVADARRAGCSWAEIATVLGVTRQSAWALFADDMRAIEKNRQDADLSEDEAVAIAIAATREARRRRSRRVAIR